MLSLPCYASRCQGRSQKFVSEGDKRVGSVTVTSGIHTDTEPSVGSGAKAKSPKHEKYAENLIECHKFRTVQTKQESSADADKPARLKRMQKLLQFDVFRFISPNSISSNCQCIASRGMFSQASEYVWNFEKFELTAVQGHPRSSILVSIESPCMTSLIVTLAVSATVFEILTLEAGKSLIFTNPSRL